MAMKFFIPQADNIEQSERVYSAIAEFIGATIQETSKRVYSITYKHNGKTMVAVVGEVCDPYYEEADPIVAAIFKGNPYKICLKDRGVERGVPIFVSHNFIISESFFE